jgi:hypothetical protein
MLRTSELGTPGLSRAQLYRHRTDLRDGGTAGLADLILDCRHLSTGRSMKITSRAAAATEAMAGTSPRYSAGGKCKTRSRTNTTMLATGPMREIERRRVPKIETPQFHG